MEEGGWISSESQGSLFCSRQESAAEGARPRRAGVQALRYEPLKFSNHVEKASPVRGELKSPPHRPWILPVHGLALFHGTQDAARLSHYFFPRLLLEGKRILMLDGANCADPRLLERMARQRRAPFEQFCRQMRIARAFTCFQLTELIARLPRLLADFPAQIVIVTAFPELYYDEDVRDWNAQVAFEQALANLRRLAGDGEFTPPSKGAFAALNPRCPHPLAPSPTGEGSQRLALTVAVFSSATTFAPSLARRRFFEKLCAAGSEVWQFVQNPDGKLGLACDTRIALPSQENNPSPGPRWLMKAPLRATLSPAKRA